jgi:hypothetical protein
VGATIIHPLTGFDDDDEILLEVYALFAWLISHQPAVLFSQNKPATNNQPTILFSQNKRAPAISHQSNEQSASVKEE